MEDRERARSPEGLYLDADWDETEDLTALTTPELSGMLEEYVREEREVSYRRRILHGRVDLICAELVRRGSEGVSAEDLASVPASAFSRHADRPEGRS